MTISAAIRFVRVCVGEKDDFYNRYLVKNNLFAPVIQLFIKNGLKHTNLIHSSIIELFEFIRLVRIRRINDQKRGRSGERVNRLVPDPLYTSRS